MCGGGSCARHTDYRADGTFVYIVQDTYLYDAMWGTLLGTRWAWRDWQAHAGEYLWAWCGNLENQDCEVCIGNDTQKCRKENGYVLLKDCNDGHTVEPLRARFKVVDVGVVDWGGTVGRRHSVDVIYESSSSTSYGAIHSEISHLARGAGLVWWEDKSGTTIGWGPRSKNYYLRNARDLGYRVEDSHRLCGW